MPITKRIWIGLTAQSVRARMLCLATLLSSVFGRPAVAQCPNGTPPPCARDVASRHRSSVAILYFETPQGDTALAYLADGLTDALIDHLTQAGLIVASRYQVRGYANRTLDDPAGLGHALNVSTLVTGTLRSLGPNLRISIELIDASTGARLWGQQFERSAEDLLHLSLHIDSLAPESWLVYGEILSDGGADDHADSAYRRSLGLDSRSAATLERFARLDEDRNRFDEALQLFDSALAVEPGFNEPAVQYRRVHVFLRLGRLPEARLALEWAGPFEASLRPLVLLSANDAAAARAAVESLPHPSFPAVVGLATLGEPDQALAMLESIAHPTLSTYRSLRLQEMDPIRGEPRFQRLLAASQPAVYLR